MNDRQLKLTFDIDPLQLMSADDIFARADEALLRKLNEDRRLEKKPARFSGDSLGEYFSMWANTSPEGGLIVSGMKDKKNGDGFEGCLRLSSEELNNLEKGGRTHCPDAQFESKRVEVRNINGAMDFVVLFRVRYREGLVVRTTKGKVFRRIADEKCELKPEQIRELQADKGEISIEQQPSNMEWPIEFDQNAIDQFVLAVRTARGLSESHKRADILKLRRLGVDKNGSFRPNVACALLFASDPVRLIPGCKIRFQRFEGEFERTGERYNAVKDEILEGTVPGLIHQIEKILESQLRTFSPLDAKGKFFPVPEYPKPAWYEAIVNACVHRSYGNGMKNMPIFVKMFDDRLEIESPGPFPPFVTPSNIYETHQPRNPVVMDALFYMDYVKCAHEGTRRIRDTMVDMRLPSPEFTETKSGHLSVLVILRNNIKQRRAWIDRDVSKIISEAIAATLSESERIALNMAAENGMITISDANRALNINWAAAKRLLFGLTKKRIFQYVRFKPLEKNVRDPNAFFRLTSNAPLPDGAFEQKIVDDSEIDE
ncbi:MAG: hypothetical protein O2955_14215 [Planctomycetota bacterium]|nr:hypothetical protein [Planctomycetota bacterium]MDA1213666.1 hypothetical protein [Planctomycetota bacterium]